MFPGVSDNVVLDMKAAAPASPATHAAVYVVVINPLTKVGGAFMPTVQSTMGCTHEAALPL